MIITMAISVVVCFLVVGIAGLAGGYGNARDWYASLNLPASAPPNWVFAPVWTVLYILMGIAAGLVWNHGISSSPVKAAIIAFGIQLLLNAAWSPLFFGMKSPLLGLIDIVPLWGGIVVTIILFRQVSPPAALLLLPYLLWVSFAAFLNLRIWQLNR